MRFCFKLPVVEQQNKNACWLHAMATILSAGHNTHERLEHETGSLKANIDMMRGKGFVEMHTVDQGISFVDCEKIYRELGFLQISVEKPNEFLINSTRFSEVCLETIFNVFGPLILVKPAEGPGFHALPIMGAAVNPDPKSSTTELITINTMVGRTTFIPPDTFNGFLIDLKQECFQEMSNIMGLWYYSEFHNNTARISKYSSEEIEELAARIFRKEKDTYTGTPPTSGSSEHASESDASSDPSLAHESESPLSSPRIPI